MEQIDNEVLQPATHQQAYYNMVTPETALQRYNTESESPGDSLKEKSKTGGGIFPPCLYVCLGLAAFNCSTTHSIAALWRPLNVG